MQIHHPFYLLQSLRSFLEKGYDSVSKLGNFHAFLSDTFCCCFVSDRVTDTSQNKLIVDSRN
jgi:hypothetical protein